VEAEKADIQTWHLNPLPAHPNGVRFTVFNENGDMLGTNEYFSVGGGFVVRLQAHNRADGQVNSETQTAENLYYRDINPQDATPARRDQTHGLTEDLPTVSKSGTNEDDKKPSGQPKYLFTTAGELNQICEETDLTIAQVVWENELAFRSSTEIKRSLMESEPFLPHVRVQQ
jgi:hypothetical protein